MRLCHRVVLAGLASAGLLGAAAAGAATPVTEGTDARLLGAQLALQRGDCGRASAEYTSAAQRLPDVRLAARAASLALSCGQYAAAGRAVARWRQLAPADLQALHTLVCIELEQFRIEPARAAFQLWLQAGGGSAEATVVHEIAALAEQAGVSSTFALFHDLHLPALSGAVVQLGLAELAYDDWNYRAALQYARGPGRTGTAAQRGAAEALAARAHAGLDEADAALAAASAAREAAPADQSFVLADVLQILGREADARQALETLRDQNPQLRIQAERRLGLMAFDRGDDSGAAQIFNGLLTDRDSSAVALFYLAALAERRGDTSEAMRAYQLLDGTPLEPEARARVARILLRENRRADALKVLGAADDAGIAARLQAEVAQAELLSNGGAANEALARIEDALERFPGDADLRYQQAILLERGGHTDAAIGALAVLNQTRTGDPEISNALGFILADHDRELTRAGRLIDTALHSEPDNPAILDSIGWLQFRRGAARAALPLLERAYRLDQDGDIATHWGQVLWSLGERDQARSVWLRALLADPDNESVKAALKRAGVTAPVSTGAGESV